MLKVKKQKPVRDVVSEVLDPKRHNLGDLGVALVEAARRANVAAS